MKIEIPDKLERQVQLASAYCGLSSSEYIQALLTAGLAMHAQHDDAVDMILRIIR
jgi:hypothetical protein